MPKVTTSTDDTKTPRSMRRHPKLVQAIVDADKNSINNFDGNRVEIKRYRDKVQKDLQRQQLEELRTQSVRERIGGRTNPSIVGALSADTFHFGTQPSDTPQLATLEDPTSHWTSRNILLLHLPDYTRYRQRSDGGVNSKPQARHNHPSTPSSPAQKQTPPCATPTYGHATPEAPSMSSQYHATMLPGVPSNFYPFAHTPHQSAIPPLPYPLAPPTQLQAATELVPQHNTVRTGERPTSCQHHSLRNRTARLDNPYDRPPCLTSQGIEGDCRLPSWSSNTSVPHGGASQVVDAGVVHRDEPQDRQPPIERATTTELRRDYHTVASIRNHSESTTHAEGADHASRPLGSPSKVNAHHDDAMLSTRMPECLSQNGWGNALHHRASHQRTCRTETPGMPTFSDLSVHTDDTQRALQLDSDEHAIVTSRLRTGMTSQSAACEAHSAFAPAYPSLLASTYYDYGVLAPGHTRPLSLPNATAEYARDDTFGTADPPAVGFPTYYRDTPACAPSLDLMLSQAAERAGVLPRASPGIVDQLSSRSIDHETASLVMETTLYDTSATSPSSSQAGRALITSSVLEAGCDASLPEALDQIFGPIWTHSPSGDTAPYNAGLERPAASFLEGGYYEDGRSWSWQSSTFGHDPLTILTMSDHPYYSSQGAAGSSISDSTGYNELEDV